MDAFQARCVELSADEDTRCIPTDSGSVSSLGQSED